MSALTPERVEVAAWLALCAALVVGIGEQSDWGRHWRLQDVTATAPDGEFKAPTLAPVFAVPATDRFLEVTLRPLWLPDRAVPPPATTQTQVVQTPLKDRYILTGTMITPDARFAHIVEKAGNRSRTVMEGTELAKDLLLVTVDVNEVFVLQGDIQEKLTIQTGGVAPVVAPRRASPAAKPATDTEAPAAGGTPPGQAAAATPPPEGGVSTSPPGAGTPAGGDSGGGEAKAKRPRIPFPWEMPQAPPTGNQKK